MSKELGNPEHPLVDKLIEMNMSVHELAEKIGVRTNTVYHWIARRRRPDYGNSLKVIELTGLSYRQIICRTKAEIKAEKKAAAPSRRKHVEP